MANRYWVGGTGTWNSSNTANWSAVSGGVGGASVPTAADDVFFDSNTGSGTVTMAYDSNTPDSGNAMRKCRNLDVSSCNVNLFFDNTDISVYYGYYPMGYGVLVYGDYTVSRRWYISGFPHPGVVIAKTGTACTITSTGVGDGTVNLAYGFGFNILQNSSVTLSGVNPIGLRGSLYLNSGTVFNTNGVPVDLPSTTYVNNGGTLFLTDNLRAAFQIYNFGGTTYITGTSNWQVGLSIYMNSGTISCQGGISIPTNSVELAGGTFSSAGSVTLNASGLGGTYGFQWKVASSASISTGDLTLNGVTVFDGGGKAYSTVNMGYTTNPGNDLIKTALRNTGGSISTLRFGAGGAGNLICWVMGNISATNIVLNNMGAKTITLAGRVPTIPVITASSVTSIDRVNFYRIAFANPISGTNLGNGGGNSGINSGYRAPQTWYASSVGSNQSWLNGDYYASSSGGTPSASNYPLLQDTVIIDNNTTSSNSLYFYNGVIGNVSFTSSSTVNTVAFYNTGFLFGNVTVTASTITSYFGNVSLFGHGTNATTVNIKSSVSNVVPEVNIYGPGVTLVGPMYMSGLATSIGTTTLQSGQTYEAAGLFFPVVSPGVGGDFYGTSYSPSIAMDGATLALKGGNSVTYRVSLNDSRYASMSYTGTNANIEVWDNGNTNHTIFISTGNTVVAFPRMTLRGSASSVLYFFNALLNDVVTVNELASQRTTSISYTVDSNPAYVRIGKWSINGISGTPVTVKGYYRYIGTGIVEGQYLSVQNSNVLPSSSTWYAINSTDLGGNIGWTFGAPFSGNGLLFGSNF